MSFLNAITLIIVRELKKFLPVSSGKHIKITKPILAVEQGNSGEYALFTNLLYPAAALPIIIFS